MTNQSPSRATLQDVLSAIDSAHDLSGKRKQDLRSAVRLAAKVLGAEPQLIAADPRAIGRRLDGISHLSLGVSAGRWANSRSLLRSALKLVVPVMSGASTVPLLPEWELFVEEARKVGSSWLRLGRLLRWLSKRGITPAAITRDDLDQFHEELLSDALHGNPERSWQAARQSWERMRVACSSWPQIVLEATPNPMVYSLPWAAFPVSLKVEVDLLLERLAGRDLSEEGPLRPLRPASLKMHAYELRTFASALVRQGLPAESLSSLAICLSLENYKLGLQWFYARHGSRPSRTVHKLAANMKAIARHWLKANDSTLLAMSRVVSKVAPPEQGMSDKNRDRLRPFDSHENLQAIVNLPRTIRRHLETSKSAKARKKGLSTAAMAIELLLVAPLRLGNLSQLHLDRSFMRVGDKMHLVVPKENVKNSVNLEYELLPETVELLDWYVSNHRKAEPENRYLFAGEGLTHKSEGTLRQQIMGAVKAFTGLTVNPHLFRAIAGTILLRANPGAYEVVRQVLGHRNIATTTRFYTGQADRAARRYYSGAIEKLRQQHDVKPGRKGKKP